MLQIIPSSNGFKDFKSRPIVQINLSLSHVATLGVQLKPRQPLFSLSCNIPVLSSTLSAFPNVSAHLGHKLSLLGDQSPVTVETISNDEISK